MKIGVLALQGDFEAHCEALRSAGAIPVEVRTAEELESVDGLVIPGGESTTMLKLLDVENLFEPSAEFGREKPIFGTCAGAILLANEVVNPAQRASRLDGSDCRAQRLRPADRQPHLEDRRRGTSRGGGIHPRADHPASGPGCFGARELSRQASACLARAHMVATFHPELSKTNLSTRVSWKLSEKVVQRTWSQPTA